MTTTIGVTDIDICARMLILLGEAPITTLDGTSDVIRTCNNVYPMVRSEVLSLYPWRFTLAKAQLSRLTAVPVNDYDYAFQLPANRLGGPRAVYNSSATDIDPVTTFDRYQDQLYSNDTELWIDYQADQDESKWPTYFATLMTYVMASRCAVAISDDESKQKWWQQIAFGPPQAGMTGGFFQQARYLDSMQTPPDAVVNFSLIEVRG